LDRTKYSGLDLRILIFNLEFNRISELSFFGYQTYTNLIIMELGKYYYYVDNNNLENI
jgi:hypothetical protein